MKDNAHRPLAIEQLEARLLYASPTKINFQPAGASVPIGYVVDAGDAYGPRGASLSYGWSADNRANARDRNASASPDQRYDTLNHFQRGSTKSWELSVANGAYDVTIVAGDPSYSDATNRISAEGVLVINGGAKSAGWATGTQRVTVSDGRLTLSVASGASNTKINFIEVTSVDSPPAPAGAGLSAVYFDNKDLTGFSFARVDPNVNFSFGNGSPDPSIAPDSFSARWTGSLTAATTGAYTLYTRSDDGVRLWIDGNLVINNWTNHAVTENSAGINLVAGQKYALKLEYFDNAFGATMQLSWAGPSVAKQIIPTSALRTRDTLLESLVAAQAFASTSLLQTIADIGGNTSTYVNYTLDNGLWHTTTASDWEAGFLPGQFWQTFVRTGDAAWRTRGTDWTLPLQSQTTRTLDTGFVIYNTFKPLYDATGNPAYRQIIIDSANSKMSKYNATIGAFKGWNRGSTSGNPAATWGTYIDLMMDLEQLFWVSDQTGDPRYRDAAISHARKSATSLVRPDGSSIQWAYFDTANGSLLSQEKYQGYSNTSTWSRGQAWGIYGYAMTFRETGMTEFLTTARSLADWFIDHLPADSVPLWDFDAPPNQPFRDTSAASIAASGLLELARLETDPTRATRYTDAAARILTSLTSPAYLAQGTGNRGILQHGALFVSFGHDDSATSFGDYYFLEAANRYRGIW